MSDKTKKNRTAGYVQPEDDSDIMTSSTSVVLDLEQFVPQPIQPDENVVLQAGPPSERVTFSNLQALVPDRPQLENPEPVVQRPPKSEPSITIVKPPSFRKFVLLGILMLLIVLVVAMGWRLDWKWDSLVQDPVGSMEIAAGVKAKPKPMVRRTVPKVTIDRLEGSLRIDKLSLDTQQRDKQHVIQVRGIIDNASNRIQHAITLKVTVVDVNGLAILSRRLPCCQTNTPDGQPLTVSELSPGKTAAFTAEFVGVKPFPPDLKPQAKIVFSETKKVQ